MKIADVKLSWSPSVSSDAIGQKVIVTIDGNANEFQFTQEVSSVVVEVKAMSSVRFTVITTDTEGVASVSEEYTFTLGDLEAPQPATNLFHEVVGVRDVVEPPDVSDL